MKVLHVTYHSGCDKNIKYVSKKLNWNLETQYANWNYNISSNLAKEIWEKYKDYYNSFDLIITSDTAPLSRIFLQNNFSKKIIIWICNRFDYCDQATNTCGFPDKEYYDLFKKASSMNNVHIVSYTDFEHLYANKYRSMLLNEFTIKPCCFVEENFNDICSNKDYFFIPPYHNDTIFMNLSEKCSSLGILNKTGRYNGPSDLKNIKGLIHIPYAWSNLALFENLFLNNVYFIPSMCFLNKIKNNKNNFFWSPPYDEHLLKYSEWYNDENKKLFIYFDSWEDLKNKTDNLNLINEVKINIKQFTEKHNEKMLNRWKEITK